MSLRPEPFGALAYDFGTRRLGFLKTPTLVDVVRRLGDAADVGTPCSAPGYPRPSATRTSPPSAPSPPRHHPREAGPMTTRWSGRQGGRLVDQFEYGLDAPICLTWELTYACNLACVHCLSSSGRRDPRELTTDECKALIDEFERMQIFYVNIGGGEPTVRPDFWELLDYAVAHHVGVKFSTNGFRITPERAGGSRPPTTSTCRSRSTAPPPRSTTRSAAPARTTPHCGRWPTCRAAGMRDFKLSVVCTRHNIGQLDEFKAIADRYGAQLRLTRLRPSGRGADVWNELHPTAGAAARALRLAGRPRRGGAHRRLLLPPVGLRRRAARPEPVRRRTGRLPGRPGR